MLDNGNREIFKKAFGLQETDAMFFAERLKNRHAQHNYKQAHHLGREHCYYDFFMEVEYLKKKDRNHYGGAYDVMDHYRLSNNREFFKVGVVDAIVALKQTEPFDVKTLQEYLKTA